MDDTDATDMQLAKESCCIQQYYEKSIIALMKIIVDKRGLFSLKCFCLKQSMQGYFSTSTLEDLLVIPVEGIDELLEICYGKFKWFDGNFFKVFCQYLADQELKETEKAQIELWDQVCSYVKDFKRFKVVENNPNCQVWIIDSELQKLLTEADDEAKFRYFCAGVLGKPETEFETKRSSPENNESVVNDTPLQSPPQCQLAVPDNVGPTKDRFHLPVLLVEAAH